MAKQYFDPKGKGLKSIKLTDAGQVDYWDTVVPSLYLRVGTRTRTWTALCNVWQEGGGRKQARVKLGQYDKNGGMPLDEARDKAKAVIDAAKLGQHPKDVLAQQRREVARQVSNSFEKAVENFLKHCRKKGLRDKTVDDYERVLGGKDEDGNRVNGKDFEDWQSLPLTSVDKAMVRDKIKAISDRGARVQAARTFAILRSFFNWCAGEDMIDTPPTAHIGRRHFLDREKSRDRVLSDLEIAILWRVFDKMAAYGQVFQLCLATGARIGEVLGMRKAELHGLTTGKDPEWHIPKDRTKGGQAHVVPLAYHAMEILADVPADYAFVFPMNKEKPMAYRSKQVEKARDLALQMVQRLRDAGAVPEAELDQCFAEKWTPHDLRRTFRTRLAEAGVRDDIAELLIGHQRQGIVATYNRAKHRDAMRRAMVKWNGQLTEIVNKLPRVPAEAGETPAA